MLWEEIKSKLYFSSHSFALCSIVLVGRNVLVRLIVKGHASMVFLCYWNFRPEVWEVLHWTDRSDRSLKKKMRTQMEIKTRRNKKNNIESISRRFEKDERNKERTVGRCGQQQQQRQYPDIPLRHEKVSKNCIEEKCFILPVDRTVCEGTTRKKIRMMTFHWNMFSVCIHTAPQPATR